MYNQNMVNKIHDLNNQLHWCVRELTTSSLINVKFKLDENYAVSVPGSENTMVMVPKIYISISQALVPDRKGK